MFFYKKSAKIREQGAVYEVRPPKKLGPSSGEV